MPKGLIFFCCACCILVLTIINLSIGPIISGKVGSNWGLDNCERKKDLYKDDKDSGTKGDELKYGTKWTWEECTRKKGMYDMEYTSFIFDIVIGFSCGLLGLLHLFELKKDFVEKTGLIGLICGAIGFILTFVYVVFNGLVYTTYGQEYGIYKRNGDGAFAKRTGENKYECLYYDKQHNTHSYYATYSDMIKKQYNYDKDYLKDVDPGCKSIGANACIVRDSLNTGAKDSKGNDCEYLYANNPVITITNKDRSDRFLATLILSLIVCLANAGLAVFGFLIAKSGEL